MSKSQLLQIIIDQQKEVVSHLSDESMILRSQLSFLTEMLSSKLVKVVMGIRRCGKSTLVIQAVREKAFVYFNFDDEVLANVKTEELNDLYLIGLEINPHADIFIFDEIQNVEGWELFVNKLLRKKVNLILTGSNSRLLSSELATHLTGRQVNTELFPFSFREYLISQKIEINKDHLFSSVDKLEIEKHVMAYLKQGGFPELVSYAPDSRFFSLYLKELFDKIITRDIVQRRRIKNVRALKELALLMLSHYSTQFTFQSIKRISSLNSLNTVKNYVDYIQESYLGFVVEPYSHKIKERISLPKKFYCIDLSFIDAILGKTSIDLGKKLENLVFLELKRRGHEIFYIKKPSYEVDFAIMEGRQISHLIQVSWALENEKTKKRELNALIRASDDYRVSNLTVITFNEEFEEVIGQKKISVLPLWKWLL